MLKKCLKSCKLRDSKSNRFTVFPLHKFKTKGEKNENIDGEILMAEKEKRIIEELPHKQLIMNIGKTKYTVNLHFKQGTWET